MTTRASLSSRSARPTISDVAQTAGVSKATVSRFFNHRERLLSPDIAARVEAAIAALGYVPSPMAQALSHGRSRLIGLIVADITNPYSVAVLRGAEMACKEAGYLVVLFNLGNETAQAREAIDTLAGYQVDGFILHTLGRGAGMVDAIAAQGKPVVLVDRQHSGMRADFVSLDNPAAMALTCDHLFEQGWHEWLYVTEPHKGVSTRRQRAAAFEACVQEHAPVVRGQVMDCDTDAATDDALCHALVTLRQRAGRSRRAAVVAGNSVVTLRVAQAVQRLGWRFGEDLGFIGFDDPEWASIVGPGLSTLAQPTETIGRTAARCLIERLQGLDVSPRRMLLPGTLVVRGST